MNPTTIILDGTPERVAYAQRVVGRLPPERAWDVSIKPHVDHRTHKQNSRLWKLHSLAAEHVGCGADEMHEEMLCEFFGATEVKMPNGQIRRVPIKRSSARDKKEFAGYMEFCEVFYIDRLGVFLGDE